MTKQERKQRQADAVRGVRDALAQEAKSRQEPTPDVPAPPAAEAPGRNSWGLNRPYKRRRF